MSAFTVGQLRLAALQRIRTGSGRSPLISRSTILIGTLASAASATTVSSYLSSRRMPSAPARPAGSPGRDSIRALRGAIIAWADARADLLRDLYQHFADRRPQFGRCRGDQPPVHDRGRFRQQIAEHRRRNVGPQPDLLGEDAILFGALDQAVKSLSRKYGRRDCRRRGARRRDCRGAPARPSPPRPARAVPRSHADAPDPWFSATSMRSASGQPGASFNTGPATAISSSLASRRSTLTGALLTGARRFESSARAFVSISSMSSPNTVIEEIDMLLVVAAGAVEKESGDALQRLGPLFAASRAERPLQARELARGWHPSRIH